MSQGLYLPYRRQMLCHIFRICHSRGKPSFLDARCSTPCLPRPLAPAAVARLRRSHPPDPPADSLRFRTQCLQHLRLTDNIPFAVREFAERLAVARACLLPPLAHRLQLVHKAPSLSYSSAPRFTISCTFCFCRSCRHRCATVRTTNSSVLGLTSSTLRA